MTDHRPSGVRKITIDNCTRPLSAWAEVSPVCAEAIRNRLNRGMSPHDAVFSPAVTPSFSRGR